MRHGESVALRAVAPFGRYGSWWALLPPAALADTRLQAVFMLISSDTLNFLCYFYYIKKFLFLAWEAES